jgi:hypothetical protein
MQLLNGGSITNGDNEFIPFEFFLESFTVLFRRFLNKGIYLNDIIVTKESAGSGGSNDVMSFDIKRPSAFLGEINLYLNSMQFLNKITGINVVGILRDIWMGECDFARYFRVD